MEYPLTYIHPNAKIGKNVQIGPFTTIEDNVEIGDDTWIASNVTIMSGARIGKGCKIHPGAVVSNIPQDLKFQGEESITIIGDNTTIRECVTVNRGTVDKHQTVVGSNCLLMAYVHVAHDCIIGDNCILANSVQVAGHVIIEDYVVVGGNTGVHQFVHIGAHAMIAGGVVVRKDIPPYIKAAREPLSYCGLNSIGLKRRGFSSEEINDALEVYRYLFNKGYNNSKAFTKIQEELPDTQIRNTILEFMKSSERGLVRGSS